MTENLALTALVEDFRARLAAAGQADDAQIIETHISLVLLAGAFAYKFKKPVDFGFVDFSTLARRQYFCAREVELNRRFAPRLYLGVESVETGDSHDYAVRMRRFPAHSTLAELLALGAVEPARLQAFATHLARQHAQAAAVVRGAMLGSAALSRAQIEASIEAPVAPLVPAELRDGLGARLDRAMALLAVRQAEGHVRECHGDLHCANVAQFEGELQAFDCIEFNDQLRVIDTLSDFAFLLMDLDAYGATGLGHVCLNSYLEAGGDYDGLALLPLYCAYRALVRAKVALLRAAQATQATQADSAGRDAAARHIALAGRYLLTDERAGLVVTHGVAGSGKSHAARHLAARAGFIHLRSDIERRRLAGMALDASSGSAPDSGLYTATMTRATYERLLQLARTVLEAGFSVVIDATFLHAAERAPFAALAAERDAPFHILTCSAPFEELRRRVVARAARGDDASEATVDVLERQLHHAQPLLAHELEVAVSAEALLRDDASPTPLGRSRVC